MSAARLIPLTRALLEFVYAMLRDETLEHETNLLKFPQSVLSEGNAVAMVAGGYVFGCGGVIPIWPGRAEGWMMVTALARKRDIAAGVRLAAAWLDEKQNDPAFARIEFFLLSQAPWRESFARALRIENCGRPLRKWGPDGREYCHYERVRD